jgi:hypothetical protein
MPSRSQGPISALRWPVVVSTSKCVPDFGASGRVNRPCPALCPQTQSVRMAS